MTISPSNHKRQPWWKRWYNDVEDEVILLLSITLLRSYQMVMKRWRCWQRRRSSFFLIQSQEAIVGAAPTAQSTFNHDHIIPIFIFVIIVMKTKDDDHHHLSLVGKFLSRSAMGILLPWGMGSPLWGHLLVWKSIQKITTIEAWTDIRDLSRTSTGPGFEGLTWKAEVLNLTGWTRAQDEAELEVMIIH